MSTLLLIDGYSLLYRAFFSSPPLTYRDQPIGALYGFARMVVSLAESMKPDHLVVAFDAPGATFRHEADATYKAHRSDAPDDLKEQMARVRPLLEGLGVAHYEKAGFEADDVIGTLARRGAQAGHAVEIVTGDGDQLQLAAPRVRVHLTRKGVSDLAVYGPDEVRARYGFAPERIPDYKGLKGDASDNIPGVPGIGEKTACSLLGQFESLEGLYERLAEVKPARVQKLLSEHREIAFHSRQMATIVTDLPIEADPANFDNSLLGIDNLPRAIETAREFGFRSLAHGFERRLEGGEGAAEAAAPEGAASASSSPNARLRELDVSWSVTQDATEALEWLSKADDAVALTFFEGQGGGGEQLVLARGEQALLFEGDVARLANWLGDETRPKLAHDAKALIRALDHRGPQGAPIAVRGWRSDTLLLSYLSDPARQNHPIDAVARARAAVSLPEPPAAPSKRGKTASLFDQEPDEATIEARSRFRAGATAAIERVEAPLRALTREIGHEALFEEIELPLVPVLAAMERAGMMIDAPALREIGQRLESDAARLQSQIWKKAGFEFNIGSPKQLAEVLYEKLELEKGRRTKSGGYSTDAFTLERLAQEHEIVAWILEYRGTSKLKSTYVDALLSLMDPATSRVHSSLNQTGTVSGRLSSSDPNLQNVPIRTEQGRLIRRAFIAPAGHVLLSADYSQVELRILAHITGDAPLVEAFRDGQDVHARTASALFGVAPEAVDGEMRRKAKMTNYAIAYGVSGFGLAKQLGGGSNAGEAGEFIKTYFETLPGVKEYIDRTLEEARRQGFVQTLMGRRRPLPDIRANAFQVRSAAERTAINHPIQGTAADIMKLAMLGVARELEERGLGARIVMQVHDELVLEVPEHEIEQAREIVERVMARAPTQRLALRVPLMAEAGIGANWQDTKAP